MNKKSGFTLAEVLVTLMIIGVIAAMTIPSLMQSTAQQEYKAALKKAVSMLNQAITLNYALDGEDVSDFTGTAVTNLFAKRLNVMSQSGTQFYTADGMWFNVVAASGTCSNALDANELNAAANKCARVQVDVNGMKGPNAYTTASNKIKDLYTLAVYPQSVLPDGEIVKQVLYMK